MEDSESVLEYLNSFIDVVHKLSEMNAVINDDLLSIISNAL